MAQELDIQIDGQTPQSWANVVAQFDDASIYQTWAYGAVHWGERNLSHFVGKLDGHPVAAAQLRIARVPKLPAGIAYLRWGPLCSPKNQGCDPAVLGEFVRRLKAEYVGRRGYALQIVPNAWSSDERGTQFAQVLSNVGLMPVPDAHVYRTIVVSLIDAPEVMRKNLDQKWRNQLNRSEKNELVFEVSDSAAAYQEFLRLYRVMWEKKQFDTSVDVDEFGRMQSALPTAEKPQVFLARKDGAAVAALVCSQMGNSSIYLLGATDEKARELKAAYFLQWQTMMWLKNHGARGFDLGGIDPVANPGGYHFKSGFGGAELTQLPMNGCEGGLLSRLVTAYVRWRKSSAAKTAKQEA
ncbi:MAG: hypothetical protein JWM32_573 [Verrucomicrobia bacterium]|nr:hypothetical protein [Verrucomicrobiota bacterium]